MIRSLIVIALCLASGAFRPVFGQDAGAKASPVRIRTAQSTNDLVKVLVYVTVTDEQTLQSLVLRGKAGDKIVLKVDIKTMSARPKGLLVGQFEVAAKSELEYSVVAKFGNGKTQLCEEPLTKHLERHRKQKAPNK